MDLKLKLHKLISYILKNAHFTRYKVSGKSSPKIYFWNKAKKCVLGEGGPKIYLQKNIRAGTKKSGVTMTVFLVDITSELYNSNSSYYQTGKHNKSLFEQPNTRKIFRQPLPKTFLSKS